MPSARQPLVDPHFRAALTSMVKRRVPESDAEDIVQSALTEALASRNAPDDPEAMRKWVWGIARNKIADFYRRNRRETAGELPDVPVDPENDDVDLLRWAQRELPPGSDSPKTLEWMLREGEGDKLETIARDEALPAPRVRQRVSRLRRHFRSRWAQQIAALAASGILVTLLVLYVLKRDDKPVITQETPVPGQRHADELRRHAIPLCEGAEWKRCVDELDRAKKLDPAGDTSEDVQRARKRAAEQEKLENAPPPEPSAVPSAAPSALPPLPTASGTTSLAPPAPTGSAFPSKAGPTKTIAKPAPTPVPTNPKASPFSSGFVGGGSGP
jgi:DNA-directed RNA polymerase specialized sigma24 family protein